MKILKKLVSAALVRLVIVLGVYLGCFRNLAASGATSPKVVSASGTKSRVLSAKICRNFAILFASLFFRALRVPGADRPSEGAMCNGDVDGGGPAVVPALQKEVCRALPAGHTHFVSHLLAGCTNEMEGFHLRRMPRVELVLVAAEEVVAEGISGLAAEGGRTAKERAVFSAGDQPEPETHQNHKR